MLRNTKIILATLALCLLGTAARAQSMQDVPQSNVISKSVMAIGYTVGGGGTKVDLKGTDLMPQANGVARVQAKPGATTIEVTIENLESPLKFGAEFLTYVLWAVSPDGHTSNTGEIVVDNNGEGKLRTTTPAQTFSLIVTAEPYFAVRLPSEVLVLENERRNDTQGKLFPVNDFKLMRRAQYETLGNPLAMTLDLKNVPLMMYEARNAVHIAMSHHADTDAPEIYTKATASLQLAENALASHENKKKINSLASQTVQFAEDARALSAQRQDQARIAAEQAAAAAQAKAEAEAKAAVEAAAAKQRADQEAARQAELAAAKQAQMKAEADAANAKEQAAQADAERARKAAADLRAQLLEQLNRVLVTTDTPRGLIVNMGDVLFDFGKFTLRPEAKELLSKLTGIILAHPGLDLAIEGHTDNVGSDQVNQVLSEKRADGVRDYLISQGLPDASITAMGFGKTSPIASNDTAAGRQQNRCVQIVVSGEAIGVKFGK
jgi:outer membrane protein OmpA-like peptidoglycan-associated protein